MKKLILFSSLLCYIVVTHAQYIKSPHQNFDLSFSSNGSQHAAALGWNHLYEIGKKKNFRLGYRLRLSQNFGTNTTFVTAPAERINEQTGLGFLFSEYVPENSDTLTFSNYSVDSLNLSIHLNYRIKEMWELEFNNDRFRNKALMGMIGVSYVRFGRYKT